MGTWVFQEFRKCLICRKSTEIEAASLNYGSYYDGEIVCPQCCEKYIDPIIEKALKEQDQYHPDSMDDAPIGHCGT